MDTTKTKKNLEKMLFIVSWIARYDEWIAANEYAMNHSKTQDTFHLETVNLKLKVKQSTLHVSFLKLALKL